MGLIGRWIDSLPEDRMRDHIIEHPDPTFNGEEYYSPEAACGCLTGCVAVGEGVAKSNLYIEEWLDEVWPDHSRIMDLYDHHREDGVSIRFYDMCQRFTPERMWRLVKARAAKRNRVTLPEPEKATAVEVA